MPVVSTPTKKRPSTVRSRALARAHAQSSSIPPVTGIARSGRGILSSIGSSWNGERLLSDGPTLSISLVAVKETAEDDHAGIAGWSFNDPELPKNSSCHHHVGHAGRLFFYEIVLVSYMLALLLLQAVAVTPAGPPTPPIVPLWRDLRVGMTPEQAAVALRSVEGISDVEVRRDRRGRFRSLRIKYSPSGVVLDGLKVEVQPVFSADGLQEVNLSGSACAGAARERGNRLGSALAERYGQRARERVVDEQGVQIEERIAFWNEQTRVRMSWRIDAPVQSGGHYVGGGVGGALAGDCQRDGRCKPGRCYRSMPR